jgi:mercuric ion transport protein
MRKLFLTDKLASIGAVVAAAACPICFPKLALIGAFFGLGAFSAYEYQVLMAAQILVVVALLGHGLAWRRHRRHGLLGMALVSGVAVFSGFYVIGSELLIYAGFIGLVGASAVDFCQQLRRKAAAAQGARSTRTAEK